MTRGYAAVALVGCKSGDNFGTALRSAVAFDVALLQLVRARFKRQTSDVSKSWRKVPLLETDDLAIPYDCVPVAVDLLPGARSLPTFVHPERALYVFGPEDGTLPDSVVRRCALSVVIPGRYCLNLAQAVTCVLYDRAAKRGLADPVKTTKRAAAQETIR